MNARTVIFSTAMVAAAITYFLTVILLNTDDLKSIQTSFLVRLLLFCFVMLLAALTGWIASTAIPKHEMLK